MLIITKIRVFSRPLKNKVEICCIRLRGYQHSIEIGTRYYFQAKIGRTQNDGMTRAGTKRALPIHTEDLQEVK